MAGGDAGGPKKSDNKPEEEQSVGKKVLSDVSVAQITASALAAVTSMLFSSQIGLAGSAIGVAASAAVTALSSQIYKSFITASKEKAKKQFSSDSNSDTDKTTVMPGAATAVRPGTTPLNTNGASAKTAAQPQSIYGTDRSKYSANSAKYSHKAAKSHKHAVMGSLDITKKKWFAIAIMTVVGLLTVFITAHVINTATSGEGLGTKTAPIIRVNDTESSSVAGQSSAVSENQDGQPSSSSTVSESSSSNGNTDANQGGNAVSSSSSNGNGGNTSNNGNTSSSSSNGVSNYSSSSNTAVSSSSSAAANVSTSSSSNTASSSSSTR